MWKFKRNKLSLLTGGLLLLYFMTRLVIKAIAHHDSNAAKIAGTLIVLLILAALFSWKRDLFVIRKRGIKKQ